MFYGHSLECHTPDTILEKGDIVIYYKSPEDVRGYGTTYAFRGDELLYIDSWGYNDRSVEFGPNYMKYAEQYKKDIITIIADAVSCDVVGGTLGDSVKKIYGELKK